MSARSVSNRRSFAGKTSFLFSSLAVLVAVQAQEDLGNKIACEVKRVFDERRSAVVRVEAIDHHGKLCGTGFFADPAGTVYTLATIVAKADEVFIVQDNRKLPAVVLVADPRSGIALIKAECDSAFIPVGNSRQLNLAAPVMTIGFPVALNASPSLGTIAGFDRQFLGKFFMTTHLRAMLSVAPGFGGAPLLNLNGEVVGIIFSGVGGGMCYALPIEAAEKIRRDYMRFGEPRHGWVGVNVEEQEHAEGGSRVRIVEMGSDTPAARAGLLTGDILLKVGDYPITRADDVIDASYFLTAGDHVGVSVLRQGETVVLDVQSGTHPATDADGFSPEGLQDLHALLPGVPPEPTSENWPMGSP